MKTLIITLIISLTLESATFKFKDGTVVNGNIFTEAYSVGNPSPEGIHLVVNNKFYIHHYPLKTREKIIDHGNGTYTITEETLPTPAPPPVGGLNPHQLPNCLPARINFVHFSHETLNNLYKYYGNKVKYHKSVIDKYPNSTPHRVAFQRNRSIAISIYRAAYTKKFVTNSKELSSNWNKKVKKEFSFSPVTWFGN
jgi:hypothetical protein